MYDVSLDIFRYLFKKLMFVNRLTSFVSEVVFLKMPSRQEKKRAKRHAKYLEVRDDVLESARASYKAEPEKKRTAERE